MELKKLIKENNYTFNCTITTKNQLVQYLKERIIETAEQMLAQKTSADSTLNSQRAASGRNSFVLDMLPVINDPSHDPLKSENPVKPSLEAEGLSHELNELLQNLGIVPQGVDFWNWAFQIAKAKKK